MWHIKSGKNTWATERKKTSPGADEYEHAAPMLSLLQTDLFLVSLFFSERKAVAVP